MKFLVFLGTIRDSTPPSPARLGNRVAKAVLDCLNERYAQNEKGEEHHQFELIDAIDYPPDPIFKPHFAYSKRNVPDKLEELAQKIEQADGYIMISPEYNHSMSPALAHLLNHFGSSLFSFKPSAIVTYSAGQWGGMRAAVNMRTYLSELGCLPVSSMIHVPNAQDVFAEDGTMADGQDRTRWFGYFEHTFAQLLWWATATKNHKAEVNPHHIIQAFKSNPKQRNAP